MADATNEYIFFITLFFLQLHYLRDDVLPPRELPLELLEPLPIERVVVDDEPTLRLLDEPTEVLRVVVVEVPYERFDDDDDDDVPRTVVDEDVLRLDEVDVPLLTLVVVVVPLLEEVVVPLVTVVEVDVVP